jgi:hypothetical protein
MMIAPNCPDHGRMALDLVLGRLDDEAAAVAEDVREICPVCQGWWQAQFGTEAAAAVDDAIAGDFDDLRLPARRRNRGWMAAAAVVVMTLGAGTLWLVRDPGPAEPVAIDLAAVIQTLDFEAPESAPVDVRIETLDVREGASGEPVFVPARIEERVADAVVAEAPSAEVPAPIDPVPLFAGGFETGDLSGWVPST